MEGATNVNTMITAIIFTYLGIALLAFVLLIVGRWKVFSKAGEKGWKALIPVYADYVQWKIGWNKKWTFWLFLGLLFGGFALMGLGGYPLDSPNSFAAMQELDESSVIMPLLMLGSLAIAAAFILQVIALLKFFQSFGHGWGFLFLYMFLLNSIMLLIIGFGKSPYLGPRN